MLIITTKCPTESKTVLDDGEHFTGKAAKISCTAGSAAAETARMRGTKPIMQR